jgi:hypothetical protein
VGCHLLSYQFASGSTRAQCEWYEVCSEPLCRLSWSASSASLTPYATRNTVVRVTELSCFLGEDNVAKIGFFPGTFLRLLWLLYIKWLACHHSMACPQVADGGNDHHLWMVIANLLNKQSWTRGGPPSGRWPNNTPWKCNLFTKCYKHSRTLADVLERHKSKVKLSL